MNEFSVLQEAPADICLDYMLHRSDGEVARTGRQIEFCTECLLDNS
jgi:hypothetical protein